MARTEYEYMPQDWDFSISHLGLPVFAITLQVFPSPPHLPPPFFFSPKHKAPFYMMLINTTFLIIYNQFFFHPFGFCCFSVQAFDCFLTSVLHFCSILKSSCVGFILILLLTVNSQIFPLPSACNLSFSTGNIYSLSPASRY